MGFLKRFLSLFLVVSGFAVTSQGPEFAQQYRQRLGGAVEELKTVVADLDRDAAAVATSRTQALEQMTQSSDPFTKSRGESMTNTVARFESLTQQQADLRISAPVWRPLVVFQSMDTKIASDAYSAYEPAVPLTVSGVFWGLAGAFMGWLLLLMGRLPSKMRKDEPNAPTGTDLKAPQIAQE
ncbi:MAG: DUF2937 family protein [Pseudomonadota bacterium]